MSYVKNQKWWIFQYRLRVGNVIGKTWSGRSRNLWTLSIKFVLWMWPVFWQPRVNNSKNWLVFANFFQIKLYKSCAIGRTSHDEGSAETWVAYANNWHHKKKKYSCVALAGVDRYGKECTWYAMVNAFLSFKTGNKGQFLNHSLSLHLFSSPIFYIIRISLCIC